MHGVSTKYKLLLDGSLYKRTKNLYLLFDFKVPFFIEKCPCKQVPPPSFSMLPKLLEHSNATNTVKLLGPVVRSPFSLNVE